MILLQILLIPGVILLMLSMIIVIGVIGTENPHRSTKNAREAVRIDEPNTLRDAHSIYLPHLSLSSQNITKDRITQIATDIIKVNPPSEALTQLPIVK